MKMESTPQSLKSTQVKGSPHSKNDFSYFLAPAQRN